MEKVLFLEELWKRINDVSRRILDYKQGTSEETVSDIVLDLNALRNFFDQSGIHFDRRFNEEFLHLFLAGFHESFTLPDLQVLNHLKDRFRDEIYRVLNDNKKIETQRSGIFLEVGGNIVNNGLIQTVEDAPVEITIAENYSSGSGKIIQNSEVQKIEMKGWWEKPLGIILIGLILAGLVYLLGWN